MSWSITAAGKGSDISAKIKDQVEWAKKGANAAHVTLIEEVASLAEEFAGQFPEKIVVIESSGHVDSSYGNATFAAKVFQP